jgi:hypothetical protein
MILTQITAGKQMILGGISCRTPSTVISLPTQEDVVCSCDFASYTCDYEELAFAYPADESDSYRNDLKSILITLVDKSGTYEFFLVKDDIEYAVTDDTYGKLFDLGFNESQPLKVGYRFDWLKVYNILGGGIYTIRIKQTNFTSVVTTDSHNIRVMPFSELAAQDTVRIETYNKGVFLDGEDYEGSTSWRQQNRIAGSFGNEQQQNEILRLKDGNYSDYDVQTDFYYQYTLETHLLPSSIADLILNNDTKTDIIYINNYDVFAYKQYRDLKVIAEGSVDSSEDYVINKNKKFTITFEDKDKNIKRNFQ